ncbi:MAG: hypothetical protein R6V85_13380 [Polyangia bacterium]
MSYVESESTIKASRSGAVVIARFEDEETAAAAAESLNASLAMAASEVEELFERGDGAADGADVSRIYSRIGMRNEVGWEQEQPLTAVENELIWQLPSGAHPEDAESLLWSLGSESVIVGDLLAEEEPWRAAPGPIAIPAVDEETGEVAFHYVVDDEEDLPMGSPASHKRTIH